MTKVQKLIETAMQAVTPALRLEAFLLVDPSGLPGATGLRDRQARIRTRLSCTAIYLAHKITGYKIAASPRPGSIDYLKQYRITRSTPVGGARGWRKLTTTGIDCDSRRAHATGDAAQALALANSYHRAVAPLYSSSRATVVYGHAAQDVTDWEAYAKSYGRPANFKNAAAHVRYTADGPVAILHAVRWRRARHIEVPLVSGAVYGHPGLLANELYAIERRKGIVIRHLPNGDSTGFAVRLPAIDGPGEYWEHGGTLAACREEYQRKLRLHADRMLMRQATQRQQRKARLIARLCGAMVCTVQDATALGYCRPGIDAFRSRHQLAETATVTELKATGDRQVIAVIAQAALRCAATPVMG